MYLQVVKDLILERFSKNGDLLLKLPTRDPTQSFSLQDMFSKRRHIAHNYVKHSLFP